jgi:two-component system LytT family response regulator
VIEQTRELKMSRLVVKIGRKIIFLNPDDISYIESERGYLRIHNDSKSFILKDSLKTIEKKLDMNTFIRVNRSVIINVNCIKELRIEKDWSYCVILKNEKSWIWGRRFHSGLKRLLGQ